ncbi:MAG: acetylglutamate kinase [Leptospiraceae bacterium]|nr:acetylglutamate kinase [Leptospiraceae bacterium]MCP5495031.1 acetylglutamate kinase [Leptospiraceae bacterium]
MKDILLKLFEITGNVSDSLVFLKNFKSKSPEKFAVVRVGTDVISEYAEHLFYDLKLLYQLELYPVLLMDEKSIEYLKIFYNNLYKILHDQTGSLGLKINIIPFSSHNRERILRSIEEFKIPILVVSTKNYLSEAFPLLQQVITELDSNKLILLESSGGLRKSSDKSIINIINLSNDYENVIQIIDPISQELLNSSKEIVLATKNSFFSVAITSPLLLFKELFTVKGSGTLIKRGSKIEFIASIKNLDKYRLHKLLESSFKKKLNPDFLEEEFKYIILEANYRGAAIIQDFSFGYLLSKFAVDEIARGEGIGRDIWEVMREKLKTIFWRAKPSNPINKWYMKECQGCFKFQNWNIYWIGLEPNKILEITEYLTTHPEDFIETIL